MYSSTTLHRAWLLILSILVIASTQAAAQAGQLDPTFGTGGIVTTDFGNIRYSSNAATASAVTIQPDGKILVCGGVPSSTGFSGAALARYNKDGSLDKGFGNAGVVVTPSLTPFTSITLQTDGKIVVAGPSGGLKINVARYTTKGSLDSTFGTGGIFTSGFIVGSDGPSNVIIQPDGKILVADGAMLRLLSDGQLDTSFGTAGQATVLGSNTASMALLPNGRILVGLALATGDFASSGFVTRYKSNGNLDTSFGINGQLASAGPANRLVLLSTGEFLVDGSLANSLTGPSTGFAVSRYLGMGLADAKFATHGGVVTPVPNFPTIATSGLGVQSSGDIVTLGTASANFSNFVFALTRYTPAGKLDTTFGTNGIVTTSFGSDYVTANALAIQSDDKIVAVGSYIDQSSDTGFKLTRYLGH